MISYGFCLGDPSGRYSSEDFAGAFHPVTGSGVCRWGNRFALSVEGMSATLQSGFALAFGRWLKSDGPYELLLSPGWDHGDRFDLVGVRVDLEAKRAALAVLEGAAQEPPPGFLPLYRLRVKRGAVNLLPEDVEDLRIDIPSLAQSSREGLRAYGFVTSGLDRRVEEILALGDGILKKGDRAIEDLDAAIRKAGGMPAVGELTTGRRAPQPESGWLLCHGGPVPEEYPELAALGLEALPDIRPEDPRLSTWIFAGEAQREDGV